MIITTVIITQFVELVLKDCKVAKLRMIKLKLKLMESQILFVKLQYYRLYNRGII